MRIAVKVIEKVKEIDARNRRTWDTRAIGFVTGISHGSVGKILKEVHGPKPVKAKPRHDRRTKFNRCDVMWSSDFTDMGNGRKLIKTIDEKSDYRLGWDVACSESAQALVEHARGILERMGRAPLAWKYDNGSCFKSKGFKQFLEQNGIMPYAIRNRAPWTNGRTERDHKEVKNWIEPVKDKLLTTEELEKDIDDGMLMLNYVKPRATLGYKTSAAVYFYDEGITEADRHIFFEEVRKLKEKDVKYRRNHRKAVRVALKQMGLYDEWISGKKKAECVNRYRLADVAK